MIGMSGKENCLIMALSEKEAGRMEYTLMKAKKPQELKKWKVGATGIVD